MLANLEDSAVATGLEKISFIPSQRRGVLKYVHTEVQLYLFSVLIRLCSKSFKLGFSNTQTVNFQMFKLVLEKAEQPKTKLPTSAGSWKMEESSRKTSISALLTMPKPLIVWITINCGKF